MPEITLQAARELARGAAANDLQMAGLVNTLEVLSSEHLTAEHCWMFFRNPEIEIPEAKRISMYLQCSAYAVSRRGEVRMTVNFSSEPAKLRDYLALMSAYFAHKELGAPKPIFPDWMK